MGIDEQSLVADILARGRQAWPTLAPDPPVEDVVRGKLDIASTLDADEVFVTAALLAGDPMAAPAFESKYFVALNGTLARAGATDDEITEIRQLLRARFLVPDESGRLRIVDYCGLGRLGGLLRVSALRTLLNLRAKEHATCDVDGALANRLASEIDPQRMALAVHERADVADAIRTAALALDSRSRALLRLNLVEGLSIDELAKRFAIHRATAARQLARARTELIASVRERLAVRWGTSGDALALASSWLEITLDRLLRTGA